MSDGPNDLSDRLVLLGIHLEMLQDAALHVYRSKYWAQNQRPGIEYRSRDDATVFVDRKTTVSMCGAPTMTIEWTEDRVIQLISSIEAEVERIRSSNIPDDQRERTEDVIGQAVQVAALTRRRLEVINRHWAQKETESIVKK